MVVRSANKRIMHVVNNFTEQFRELDKTYNKYKDFINNEFEVWESIKLGLEKVIQKKEDEIEQLKDALSLPRKHYKFIDNLTSEKIIEQKNLIITEMAKEQGIAAETLLEDMY